MTKKLITAVLLSLIVVLLIGTTAFADTMEELVDEQNVEEQIVETVEKTQEEDNVPEDDADVISVQGVPEAVVNGEESSLSVDDISYLSPVYVDNEDVTKGVKEWEIKTVSDAEKVSDCSGSVTWGTEGESTWYAVTNEKKRVTLSQGVICKGNVNLILCDGTRLEVYADNYNAGILVSGDNNSLTIYAQSTGDNAGKLIAKGGDFAAGIGGGDCGEGNNITINGGTVTAAGGEYGAGIGGGFLGNAENLTINGGTVTATGGEDGSGIGGGDRGYVENLTINGGTVTATGGSYGAGIGGGYCGNGNNITITGGTVKATGGKSIAGNGAGIGGGYGGNANNVKVSGALVVFAGTNFSVEEMKTISHDDDTDLSTISDFINSPCVLIQPINNYSSAAECPFKVIVVALDSLSTAQQEAIKRFIEENGVTIISAFKVINNGGPINKEKIDIPIDLQELGVDSKIDIKDLRIFQLKEDNTLSEVPFTQGQDNRTLGMEVGFTTLPFILVAMKNK